MKNNFLDTALLYWSYTDISEDMFSHAQRHLTVKPDLEQTTNKG